MYDFYITLIKEVVRLGQHSYDEATDLMSRAGAVDHELNLRPILEEALNRCAEHLPMVVSLIRSQVAERHAEAVGVEHGISDSSIVRIQDVEPEVPAGVAYGISLLQDEPDEFWTCADPDTRRLTAEWLLSDDEQVQASLRGEFGNFDALKAAQGAAREYLASYDPPERNERADLNPNNYLAEAELALARAHDDDIPF